MSWTRCQFHATQRKGLNLELTPALWSSWKMKRKSVTVHFGNRSIQLNPRLVKGSGRRMRLSQEVKRTLLLPSYKMPYVHSSSDALKIGPLLAIMSTADGRSLTRPFGNKSHSTQSLLKGCQRYMKCFAFAPQDVNTDTKNINGFIWKDGKWYREKMPYPNVVYNRILSRSTERDPETILIKQSFEADDVTLFNWDFLNKWDVYAMLRDDKSVQSMLPETIHQPAIDDIRSMLQQHRTIYLKPAGGSMGMGIWRITYIPKEGIFLRLRQGTQNTLQRFSTFRQLQKVLERRHKRNRADISQQGIDLLRINQCPLDYRLHLMKNGQNKWTVAGIAAKKAGRGSVTTHVRTGGEIMPIQDAFQGAGVQQPLKLLQQLKDKAIQLAEAIEIRYPHTVAELGFDMGIDRDLRIWMFEANAKPGRSIFKHPTLKTESLHAYRTLANYCRYMSEMAGGQYRE